MARVIWGFEMIPFLTTSMTSQGHARDAGDDRPRATVATDSDTLLRGVSDERWMLFSSFDTRHTSRQDVAD
ncbi:hypothetical protein M378DRAFT_164989 [Amanita muscaria Koide BX008]|uniref:Uncharacterized protein n=1 Tax=Amanita muscaria (strain Koide BX008) TaxID=946122 RepID=A0A0C2X1C7_AMAMK|nr:hypothetical protein M378DRAFT_164989 [Amanita muscaria Koide BX008]